MAKYHPSIVAGKPASPPALHNPAIAGARAKSKVGPRRKRLMSDIFYRLESLGGSVEGNEDSASLKIDQQLLTFRLVEQLRHVKLPLTDWDRLAKTDAFRRGHHVGLKPTGMLRLEIGTYFRGKVQQTWQDRKNKPLEDVLIGCVAALIAGAKALQEWDDERELEQEAERHREALLRKAEHEAAVDRGRWRLLIEMAEAQNQATRSSSGCQQVASDFG